MRIALLHTAEVHAETFTKIFAALDPLAALTHEIAPALLATAQAEGIAAVRAPTLAALSALSARADATLCTCSTLGPLVDEAAQSTPRLLRIDRPLMRRALADGPRVLLAYCLESTLAPSLALLTECAAAMGLAAAPIVAPCAGAWAHFEAGDQAAYAAAIAAAVEASVAQQGGPSAVDSVVLAQASMRVAEPRLSALGPPIRSAPVLAAEAALTLASGRG